MDLTLEKFDDLLKMLLEKAKTNRQRYGYKSKKFAQCAIVVGPQCEQAVLPLTWDTAEEKHAMMYALSQAARMGNASAVVLIVDTRWSDSDRFSAYFNMPLPKEIGHEEWQKLHYEIRMRYGNGDMEYLPREVWEEAVCVVGRGPLVGTKALFAPYREIVGDSLEWVSEPILDGDEYASKMLMLDDWWSEPTKQ